MFSCLSIGNDDDLELVVTSGVEVAAVEDAVRVPVDLAVDWPYPLVSIVRLALAFLDFPIVTGKGAKCFDCKTKREETFWRQLLVSRRTFAV
jgi:hypothetical protein